jgi:hypothetical protein
MKKRLALLFVSALAAFSTVHAEPARHTRNLVLVVVDGARWKEIFRGADPAMLADKRYVSEIPETTQAFGGDDAQTRRSKLMPFVWSVVAKQGRLYGNRDLGSRVDMRNPVWFSYPGRAEMFTGHVNPKVDSNEYGIDTDPNVFEFLARQPALRGKVAGFASWRPIGGIYDHKHSDAYFNVYPEDIPGPGLTPAEQAANEGQHLMPLMWGWGDQGERLDAATFALAKSYMQARHPRLLVLDIGNDDEFAHDHRYDLYLEALHHADAMIANIWKVVQSDPFYRGKTSLLIVPDHGRGDGPQWTSHGPKAAHSGETWLMAMGPDTSAGGVMENTKPITEDQLATTIARFFGFDFRTMAPQAAAPIGELMRHDMAGDR